MFEVQKNFIYYIWIFINNNIEKIVDFEGFLYIYYLLLCVYENEYIGLISQFFDYNISEVEIYIF